MSFDQRCKNGHNDLEALTSCGQALKERFGFPDATCPEESPLAEIDNGSDALLPPSLEPAVEDEDVDTAEGEQAQAAVPDAPAQEGSAAGN